MNRLYPDDSIEVLAAKALAPQLEPIDEAQAARFLEEFPDPIDNSPLLKKLPDSLSELRKIARVTALERSLPLTAILAMNRENKEGFFDQRTEEEIGRARSEALDELDQDLEED